MAARRSPVGFTPCRCCARTVSITDPSTGMISSRLEPARGPRKPPKQPPTGLLILPSGKSNPVPSIPWVHCMLIDPNTDGSAVVSMAVSPNGQYVAACFKGRSIRLWSLKTKKLLPALVDPCDSGPSHNILSIAWSPDSTRILCGSDRATGTIWLLKGGVDESISPEHTLIGHAGDVCIVAVSPDGFRAVTGSVDGSVKLWYTGTGRQLGNIMDLGGRVTCTRFSPNSEYLAIAVDSTVRIYNSSTVKRLVEFREHDKLIQSLSFSPTGKRIVTASGDHTVRVWETESGIELVAIKEHSGPLCSASFSPNGDEILTGSHNSFVSVWNSSTGKNRLLLNCRSRVNVVEYLPGGEYFITGCANGSVSIWANASRRLLCEIQGHKGAVNNIGFTPHGDRLVTSGEDGTIRVWNMEETLIRATSNT